MMKRCPFCFGTKLVRVIDEPTSGDQTLIDAVNKGQKIVAVDCPLCVNIPSLSTQTMLKYE